MSDTREAVENALIQAFRESGEMVTRFVLCVESIDEDGDRGLWVLQPDDMHDWETVGMLRYAMDEIKARRVVANMDDD